MSSMSELNRDHDHDNDAKASMDNQDVYYDQRSLLRDDVFLLPRSSSKFKAGWKIFIGPLLWSCYLGMLALSFLGGYTVNMGKSTGYNGATYNFDDTSILPDHVAKLIRSDTKTGQSFLKITTSPLAFGPSAPLWHQPPSPAVDAFWERYSPPAIFLLTEAEMRRLRKSPDTAVRLPPNFGYGEKRYLAKLDHLHQIHCLNLLRKASHAEYYNFTSANALLHADHCVRTLFDYLHCHVTWDVYNYVWVDREARPQPDFTSARQCRDIEAMFDFYDTHDVSRDARVRFLVPGDDARFLPVDPQMVPYLDLAELEHPDLRSEVEERRARTMIYEKAVGEWEATGEIPMLN